MKEDSSSCIALRVEQPGISLGTLLTSPQSDCFSVGQLRWCERTLVGKRTVWLTLHLALVPLPLFKCCNVHWADWTCHPEQRLVVGDEVDILVPGQGPVHPLLKLLNKALVGVEPEWCEGEGERRSVGGVVTLEVVLKQCSELISVLREVNIL